jgi:chromosome segregation ATPase
MYRMSKRTSQALPSAFRRRFPLELTVQECELLERAAERAGSKRAALLAGLAALAREQELEALRLAAEQERDAAQARLAELQAEVAEIARSHQKQTAAASAARKRTESTQRKQAEASKRETTKLASLERTLKQERDARHSLEDELAQLEERAVDWLRCDRCGNWAPPREWKSKNTEEGEVLYHGPCGFHRGGLLDPTSVLAVRRSG